jgi:hypothetical protein
MSLLQQILDKIETEAAAASAEACRCAGLIAEAETLRDTLRRHGAADADSEPTFIGSTNYGRVIFYTDNKANGIRSALAAAGLEIASEREVGHDKSDVALHIKGLECVIWVPKIAAAPLALAA